MSTSAIRRDKKCKENYCESKKGFNIRIAVEKQFRKLLKIKNNERKKDIDTNDLIMLSDKIHIRYVLAI